MAIATHLIKIKGEFNPDIWNETSLKEYVVNKITEIESTFHTETELFNVHDTDKIDVWVYVHGLPSEVSRRIVGQWIEVHIIEEGLTVIKFEIEVINSLLEPRPFFVGLR